MFWEINNQVINVDLISQIYIFAHEVTIRNPAVSAYPIKNGFEYQLIISGNGFSVIVYKSKDKAEVEDKYLILKNKLKQAHVLMEVEL